MGGVLLSMEIFSGVLGRFLGHGAWQPLSRLSKQAILFHSFVITISLYQARTLIYLDYMQLVSITRSFHQKVLIIKSALPLSWAH